jgi:hypothetical protein
VGDLISLGNFLHQLRHKMSTLVSNDLLRYPKANKISPNKKSTTTFSMAQGKYFASAHLVT